MTTSSSLHVAMRSASSPSTLHYAIPQNCTGRRLLEKQARLLDIREHWLFGLGFVDLNRNLGILKPDADVSKTLTKVGTSFSFEFRPIYFPEKLDELVETSTVREFYHFVKKQIESGNLECTDPDHKKELTDLAAVVDDLLEDRASMLKYLASASRLETYGMELFEAHQIKPRADVWLAIHAKGIKLYTRSDKQKPLKSFLWNEIEETKVNGSTFIIVPKRKNVPKVSFTVLSERVAKTIQRLCEGNRRLMLRRQRGDSLIVTQMKNQLGRELEKENRLKNKIRQLQEEIESLRAKPANQQDGPKETTSV